MSDMPERLMTLSAGRALAFDSIPGGGRPEWTAEDAAMACQGLDRRRYAAFAYRWARDESLCSTLYGCLFSASTELADRERWPTRTSANGRYLDKLVRQAIYEEWSPPPVLISRMSMDERAALFHRDPEAIAELVQDGLTSRLRPILLAALCEVSIEIWRDELSRRYEGIRGILEGWCADAHAHADRWIRDHGTDQQPSEDDDGKGGEPHARATSRRDDRNRRIVADFNAGKRVIDLARDHGMTPRHVHRLLKQADASATSCT